MAAAPSSPTARRWELAARLRQLRTDAGKTIEEAAAELMCSTAKISRMETGGRGVLPRDVRDLCRLYGVPDETRDMLIRLATESKKPGWWQNFRTLPETVATFVGLESAAERVLTLETRTVPGLLQTPEYSRILISGLRPADQRGQQEIDDLIGSRAKRQLRLEDGAFSLSAILDEAVVARTLGAPEMMQDQLDHLLTVATRPNVSLRVIPFGSRPYPGIDGAFTYLGFNSPAIPDVIFVEGMLGDFILDRPADVERYVAAYEETKQRVALSPDDTVAWLTEFRDRAATRMAPVAEVQQMHGEKVGTRRRTS